MNRDEIVERMDSIRELINSSYNCYSHSRVIRGDGGTWLTDLEEIRRIASELIDSQRVTS